MFESRYTGPKEGREYEARQFVILNELVQEMYDVAMGDHPRAVSDVALDILQRLALTVTRRDAEFGRMLERQLHQRAEERADTATNEAWRHEELARAVHRQLFEMHIEQPSESTAPEPGNAPIVPPEMPPAD